MTYTVLSDNHCPFCSKETCECFSGVKSCGREKGECESCAG